MLVGIWRLIVKIDAMLVVRFLIKPLDECHPFDTFIDVYLMLINKCWVVEVRHILREGKMRAYHLAKLVQKSNVRFDLAHYSSKESPTLSTSRFL